MTRNDEPSNPEFEAECIRRILAGEKQLFHDLIRPCERASTFCCSPCCAMKPKRKMPPRRR